MKREEILNNIKLLAKKQGFYKYILNILMKMNENQYNKTMKYLEEQNFENQVDLTIFLEIKYLERTRR